MASLLVQKYPYITHHLHIDTVNTVPEKTSPNVTYIDRNCFAFPYLGNVLFIASRFFFLAGAVFPKTGTLLRMVTEVTEFSQMFLKTCDLETKAKQALSMAFSAVATYAVFFDPKLFKYVEIFRSLGMHTRDLYHIYTHPELSKNKEKITQTVLHLLTDCMNLAISHYGSFELKFASHLLQLMAGIFDIHEQKAQNSYFGMAMHSGLTLLRLISLTTTGKKLYEQYHSKPTVSIPLSNTSESLVEQPARLLQKGTESMLIFNPTSESLMERPARLLQKGTGSVELDKLEVIKSLGEEAYSAEIFLVKDEFGELKVLKRFYTETEKIEKSPLYAGLHVIGMTIFTPFYLLGRLFGKDFQTYSAEQALDVSKKVDDPGILKVFKIIQNVYDKEVLTQEGQKQTLSMKDTYLLLEYFQGSPLIQHEASQTLIQKITGTLFKAAQRNFFYYSSQTDGIVVNGDDYRFVKHENFMNPNETWSGFTDIYESLYHFFLNLVSSNGNDKETIEKTFEHVSKIGDKDREKIFDLSLLRTTIATLWSNFNRN